MCLFNKHILLLVKHYSKYLYISLFNPYNNNFTDEKTKEVAEPGFKPEESGFRAILVNTM